MENKICKFENLSAWKKSKELAIFSYGVTAKMPKKEMFGLISQINRAAVSLAANIVEGCSRNTKKDFSHFLDIALGSAFELKTLYEVAVSQKYISRSELKEVNVRIVDCVKLVYGLKRSIK